MKKESVLGDPKTLEEYSKDYSYTSPVKPKQVIQPQNTEEVLEIVKQANETKTPIIPTSSQVHLYGRTVPKDTNSIVVDMRNFNQIKRIDSKSRVAIIGVGVTWSQFIKELEPKGYQPAMPLLPFAGRSVISDYMDRERPVNPIYEHARPLASTWVIWGRAEEFVTGTASYNRFWDEDHGVKYEVSGSNFQGPGPIDFIHFLTGSQGTLGIISDAIVKIMPSRVKDKTYFITADKLEEIIEPVYWITRRRVGEEFFILNRMACSAMLAEKWPEDFHRLRGELPPWVVIFIISGLRRHPEDKIAYQEKFLKDLKTTKFPDMNLQESLAAFPGLEDILVEMIRRPWPEDRTYWKFGYKGRCQDLTFMMLLERIPHFVEIVRGVAAKYGYAEEDIGCYLQPVETGRVWQVQFNFYYNPDVSKEVDQIRSIYREAASACFEEGAYFTRIYDILPDIVYQNCPGYVNVARRIKNQFDPNNIMNPGRLCF